MATRKQPRSSSAARKTTRKNAQTPASDLSVTSAPVSTAQPASATTRNAVIEGNATIDSNDVRRRAYELYEQSGRLEGKHEEHWYQAEAEIRRGKRSA